MSLEIILSDGRVVYMRPPESDAYAVVWVSATKFVSIWHARQKNDITRTREKYPAIETCFAQSAVYPVPYIHGGFYPYKPSMVANLCSLIMTCKIPLPIRKQLKKYSQPCKLFLFVGGITRAMWLINNGAQSFPIACSPCEASELMQLAGAAPV